MKKTSITREELQEKIRSWSRLTEYELIAETYPVEKELLSWMRDVLAENELDMRAALDEFNEEEEKALREREKEEERKRERGRE